MKKNIITVLTLMLLSFGVSCYAAGYLGMKLPLPGSTIADTKTQGNTLCYVFAKVARQSKHCRKLVVTNTKVTAEPSNIKTNQFGRKIGGTWSEVWTVNACGTNVEVPIDFEYKRNGVMSTVK